MEKREWLLDITGQPLSCTNKKALECFNKGLIEDVLVREDCSAHFIEALSLDQSLVIVRSLLVLFGLSGLQSPSQPEVSAHLEAIKAAVASHGDRLCEREMAYIRSAQAYAAGSLEKAAEELCVMLFDYPGDALALRTVSDFYIGLGEFERMRDMVARALPFWTEEKPLYQGILACYSFALEECRERDRAKEVAERALSLDKWTPFATHTIAHFFEEASDPQKGVEFLTSTRSDWTGVFQGHITWHLILYYLDLGEIDNVLAEFDKNLKQRATEENLFGLLDASSLLWRLEVMGINPGEERWGVVTEGMKCHAHKHRSPWFDAHIMFSLARGKVSESTARLTLAREMMKTMNEYVLDNDKSLPNQRMVESLGVPVCNALLAFGEEKYDEVLQIMLPLRYDFLSMGGSWAQRQVFNVTMIQAAIKADNTSVALALVGEMLGQKPNNPRYSKLYEELRKCLKDPKALGSGCVSEPPVKRQKQ